MFLELVLFPVFITCNICMTLILLIFPKVLSFKTNFLGFFFSATSRDCHSRTNTNLTISYTYIDT